MTRINANNPNLILDPKPTNWGAGIYLYNGTLFTGILEDNFDGTTQLQCESEFNDGILDGRQVEYFLNGQIKYECFEKYDVPYGFKRIWDQSGVLLYIEEFDSYGNSLYAKEYNNQGVLIGHWISNERIV